VYDVVEKTSTRRRSRIPIASLSKKTTRRREDGGVVVEKKYKKVDEHLITVLAIYLQQ